MPFCFATLFVCVHDTEHARPLLTLSVPSVFHFESTERHAASHVRRPRRVFVRAPLRIGNVIFRVFALIPPYHRRPRRVAGHSSRANRSVCTQPGLIVILLVNIRKTCWRVSTRRTPPLGVRTWRVRGRALQGVTTGKQRETLVKTDHETQFERRANWT